MALPWLHANLLCWLHAHHFYPRLEAVRPPELKAALFQVLLLLILKLQALLPILLRDASPCWLYLGYSLCA